MAITASGAVTQWL